MMSVNSYQCAGHFATGSLSNLNREIREIQEAISDLLIEEEPSERRREVIMIAILRSSNASAYLQSYKKTLQDNNSQNLLWLIGLLQTACKEFSPPSYLQKIPENQEVQYLKMAFCKPVGSGWDFVIVYIYKNVQDAELLKQNLSFLVDWTKEIKKGETTRKAGLIGLRLYEEYLANEKYFDRAPDEIEMNMVQVVINSSAMIKEEIEEFYTKLLTEESRDLDPLSNIIISRFEYNGIFINNLPEIAINIANFFWWDKEKRNDIFDSPIDRENEFGLADLRFNYNPSSALQTPIVFLLWSHPAIGIDFVLKTVNEAVNMYKKNKYQGQMETISLCVEGCKITQYIDDNLWGMYRGFNCRSDIMASIHMGLEKWLSEIGKVISAEKLIEICSKLLIGSQSASITAVVTSIVQIYPEKLFPIAKILMECKPIFSYDLSRRTKELEARNLYSIGLGWGDGNDFHRRERITTCDDAFRQELLEGLALRYQVEVLQDSAEEYHQRRMTIWSILDRYYSELPDEKDQKNEDIVWRLALARMDVRKMDFKLVKTEGDRHYYQPVPQVDKRLQEYVADFQIQHKEDVSSISFRNIANDLYRGRNKDRMSVQQVEIFVTDIKQHLQQLPDMQNTFLRLVEKDASAYACAALLRDYWDEMNEDDRGFCADIILQYSSHLFNEDYMEQQGDFAEPVIASLPVILQRFPGLRLEAKYTILKLLLLPEHHFSGRDREIFRIFAWQYTPEDAWSLLLGYLLLVHKYREYQHEKRQEPEFRGAWRLPLSLLDELLDQEQANVESVMQNEIQVTDIAFDKMAFKHLVYGLELLPSSSLDQNQEEIFELLVQQVPKYFEPQSVRHQKEQDVHTQTGFRNHFARLILHLCETGIDNALSLISGFIDKGDHIERILGYLIIFADQLPESDAFWIVWEKLLPVMKRLNASPNYHTDSAIREYLFAGTQWQEDTKSWHVLRDKDIPLIGRAVKELGSNPVALLSVGHFLYTIGYHRIEDGLRWIHDLISDHDYQSLPRNTLFYIESFMRRFTLTQRGAIKRDPHVRTMVLAVLDYLVKNKSSIGYLLREQV